MLGRHQSDVGHRLARVLQDVVAGLGDLSLKRPSAANQVAHPLLSSDGIRVVSSSPGRYSRASSSASLRSCLLRSLGRHARPARLFSRHEPLPADPGGSTTASEPADRTTAAHWRPKLPTTKLQPHLPRHCGPKLRQRIDKSVRRKPAELTRLHLVEPAAVHSAVCLPFGIDDPV